MKFKLSLQLFSCVSLSSFHSPGRQFFRRRISGVKSITKYDENGDGSPFTGEFVNGPYGLALDSSGNLYVTTNSNVIRKFGPDGTDLGVFASTGMNNAMGLAFDPSGNLYVANFGVEHGGEVCPGRDRPRASSRISSIGPTGIAFDAAGNLYVAISGNTIERFNPDGIPLSSFTSLYLNNPEGPGFRFVRQSLRGEQGRETRSRFSRRPALISASIVSRQLSGPIGLAFDTDDNLYVVNNLSSTIEKIAPDGTDSIFASTGFSPGFIAVQRTPTLVNISTRLNMLTGENVLDAGLYSSWIGIEDTPDSRSWSLARGFGRQRRAGRSDHRTA